MRIEDDLNDLETYLDKLIKNVEISDDDWRELGAKLVFKVQRGFRESVDPHGKPWAPIEPRWKKSKGYVPGQPLIDERYLMKSLATFDFRRRKNIAEISMGTNVEYGQYHNDGTSRIKQRMFLPTDSLPLSWHDDIIAHINSKLDNAIKQSSH